MKITATDLLGFGLIDTIVAEPPGGAHGDYEKMGALLDAALTEALGAVRGLDEKERVALRYNKFRAMGAFEEKVSSSQAST